MIRPFYNKLQVTAAAEKAFEAMKEEWGPAAVMIRLSMLNSDF